MPILEVEIITRLGGKLENNLASRIANAAGQIFDTSPGRTWVRLRTLPVEQYAENGVNSAVDLYPIFVTVLKSRLPEPDDMAAEVNALTTAIAQICDRPRENVHLLYLPSAAGRIAFGGRIIPEDK